MNRRRQDATEYFTKGMLARQKGDAQAALELAQRSLQALPTAEAHILRGWALALQGRLDEAIDACEKAIALDPDFGDSYSDIGSYLIEKGDYDEALAFLERAAGAKRCDCPHATHFHLGRIYQERGMLLRAAEQFRASLRIDPAFQAATDRLMSVTAQLN